jgi:murein DD-endopeptidase MepM/ murein hydrolase activator NlpD
LSGPRTSPSAPRRAQFACAIVAIVTLLTSGLVASAHASTIESERARIAQIQEEIAKKGAEIEALVAKANEARANLDALHTEIGRDEHLLVVDSRVENAALAVVRQAAVVAYMGYGTGSASGLSFFDDTSSVTRAMAGRHYLNSVNSHLDDSIAQLEIAKGRTDDDRRQLVKQQDDAQHVLDRLMSAQADARQAITVQNQTLAHATAELTASLVAQRKQKAADARRAAQRAIAQALAAATEKDDAAPIDAPRATPSQRVVSALHDTPAPRPIEQTVVDPPPDPPPSPVSSGGYGNPFRGVSGLSPERIDSGVDYAGVGPVYAIGNGVVLNIYAGDWPGGTFIAYQLSDGPAKGLVVYTAEDLNPQVSVGSTVTPNTVIGQMYGGPHGIEIGWADGSALPNAMARSAGQYHGGNSTAFGYNFSQLLQSLGAPGGILQNNPDGTLPPGWPQW